MSGIAVPVVEELYFRGFLLPRLSRLGIWAPILEMALFAALPFLVAVARHHTIPGFLADRLRRVADR